MHEEHPASILNSSVGCQTIDTSRGNNNDYNYNYANSNNPAHRMLSLDLADNMSLWRVMLLNNIATIMHFGFC
jgi:hypothetical protein